MPTFTGSQDALDAFASCFHGICSVQQWWGLYRNKTGVLFCSPEYMPLKSRITFPVVQMFSFTVSDRIVMAPVSCHYPYILIMREKYSWLLKVTLREVSAPN